MRGELIFTLLLSLLPGLASCQKHAAVLSASNSSLSSGAPAQAQPQLDACALITTEEIEAVEGSPALDAKPSEDSTGAYHVSQCYYSTQEPSRSVSLAVILRSGPGKESPRNYWQQTFGRFSGGEKEEEKEKESPAKGGKEVEHEAAPPKKIDGIGEAAFWIPSRVGGALHVLQKDVVLRMSVGGPDNEEGKLNKSKALAEKALSRL